MMAGVEVTSIYDYKKFLNAKTITLLLPGLIIGISASYLLARFKTALILPALLATTLILFYISLTVNGMTLDDARHYGWIAPLDSTESSAAAAWALYDITKVDWTLFLPQIPSLFAMFLVVAFSSSLDVAAIEMELGVPLDYNKELLTVGISNLFSGALGGYSGSYIFSQTTFNLRRGIENRLCGFIIFLGEVVIALMPISITSYVPKLFFGSLLILIATELMHEWLIQARFKMMFYEYIVCLVTFAGIKATGIEVGMFIGVIAAMASFVISYSHVQTVSAVTVKQSTVIRTFEERNILISNRGKVVTVSFSGYLFFGTAVKLLEEIKEKLVLKDESVDFGVSIRDIPGSFYEVHGHDKVEGSKIMNNGAVAAAGGMLKKRVSFDGVLPSQSQPQPVAIDESAHLLTRSYSNQSSYSDEESMLSAVNTTGGQSLKMMYYGGPSTSPKYSHLKTVYELSSNEILSQYDQWKGIGGDDPVKVSAGLQESLSSRGSSPGRDAAAPAPAPALDGDITPKNSATSALTRSLQDLPPMSDNLLGSSAISYQQSLQDSSQAVSADNATTARDQYHHHHHGRNNPAMIIPEENPQLPPAFLPLINPRSTPAAGDDNSHDDNPSIKEVITEYLVLDFSEILGIDATSARSCFLTLVHLMRSANVTIVFAQLKPSMEALLRVNRVISERSMVMPKVDDALEWCEDQILQRSQCFRGNLISPESTGSLTSLSAAEARQVIDYSQAQPQAQAPAQVQHHRDRPLKYSQGVPTDTHVTKNSSLSEKRSSSVRQLRVILKDYLGVLAEPLSNYPKVASLLDSSQLLHYFVREIFPVGTIIFNVEETADKCYFIEKGVVELLTTPMGSSSEGKDVQRINKVNEGGIFGEADFILGRKRRYLDLNTLTFTIMPSFFLFKKKQCKGVHGAR